MFEGISESIRQQIADRFDPEELLDLLGIGIGDLIDAFENEISDKLDAVLAELYGEDDVEEEDE